MQIQGKVLVEDIISALGLEVVPAECSLKLEEWVTFDDVAVDEDHAYDALNIDEQEEDAVTFFFDQSDVQGLGEAIRIGNRQEAELLLDRMFSANPTLREWMERGRFSKRAREARLSLAA